MNFNPVRSLNDLETLNDDEIVDGYVSTKRGDPEPGLNRGRSFWHGWRNRMMDFGEIPQDDASMNLIREWLQRDRLLQNMPWPMVDEKEDWHG